MAYHCRKYGGECDGCGSCREGKPVLYADNGQPIYSGEKYYDFDGEIVLEDDLREWAAKYAKTAEVS